MTDTAFQMEIRYRSLGMGIIKKIVVVLLKNENSFTHLYVISNHISFFGERTCITIEKSVLKFSSKQNNIIEGWNDIGVST